MRLPCAAVCIKGILYSLTHIFSIKAFHLRKVVRSASLTLAEQPDEVQLISLLSINLIADDRDAVTPDKGVGHPFFGYF